jgi:hypothetical protein
LWIFLLWLRLGSFSAPTRLGWLIGPLADEPPGHDRGGGPQQRGLVMLGEPLVVTDQTPVPVQPAETTFHDPPAGEHDESADVVGALDDGDGQGRHGRSLGNHPVPGAQAVTDPEGRGRCSTNGAPTVTATATKPAAAPFTPMKSEIDAIDLLDTAGSPVLKRLAPVIGGALLLLIVFLIRRSRN